MDQLRKQVARARRRLIIEQFLGRLIWCLLGALIARGNRDRRTARDSYRRSARELGLRLADRRFRCRHCRRRRLDFHLEPQPDRCGHRDRPPLRSARARRQQPVAVTGRTIERSRPGCDERCAPCRRTDRCRRKVPRRESAAAPGGRSCRPQSCLHSSLSSTIARHRAASIRRPPPRWSSKPKTRSNRSARNWKSSAKSWPKKKA